MLDCTIKSYRSEILDSIRKMGTENLESAFAYFISGFEKNFFNEFDESKSKGFDSLKIFLKSQEKTFYLDKETLSGTFKEFRYDLKEFKELSNLGLFNFKFSQADIESVIYLNRKEFKEFLKEKFKKKIEECYLFFLNDFNSLIREERFSVSDLIKSRSCFPLLDVDNMKLLLNNNRTFSWLINGINSKEIAYILSCCKKILFDEKLIINSNIRNETLESFKKFCLEEFEQFYNDFIKKWDSSLLVNENLIGILQHNKKINNSAFKENQEAHELILKLYENKLNFNDSIKVIKSLNDLNFNSKKINGYSLFILNLYFDKTKNKLTTKRTVVEKSKQVTNTSLYYFKLNIESFIKNKSVSIEESSKLIKEFLYNVLCENYDLLIELSERAKENCFIGAGDCSFMKSDDMVYVLTKIISEVYFIDKLSRKEKIILFDVLEEIVVNS